MAFRVVVVAGEAVFDVLVVGVFGANGNIGVGISSLIGLEGAEMDDRSTSLLSVMLYLWTVLLR